MDELDEQMTQYFKGEAKKHTTKEFGEKLDDFLAVLEKIAGRTKNPFDDIIVCLLRKVLRIKREPAKEPLKVEPIEEDKPKPSKKKGDKK